jgi:2-(1,2-epoxy-1,2-dihydrophenyl)acetyl-CoA isomerase
MSEPTVLFEHAHGIARITLNRPDKLNAFTQAMHAALRAALDEAESNPATRVIVLAASGRGFCAGQDLADAGVDPTKGPVTLHDTLENNYKPLITRIANAKVPVIAAVNGVAAGAGVSLALACDIVIAAQSASFGMAFAKIGLIPDAGSTYFFPRAIGTPLALAYALTGEKLPAERAAQLGMIWKCVPDADFLEAVNTLSKQLASSAPKAIAAIKSMLRASGALSLAQSLNTETATQDALGKSADYAEGVLAFKEKRAPHFSGR